MYQGAYKSFIVQEDKYCIDLIRYVEQNPLRAKLVTHAEDWQWGSLYRRTKGSTKARRLLSSLPTRLPANYLASVNEVYNRDTLEKIRHSVQKGTPYGGDGWVARIVADHHLESTLRPMGRPRKG